MDGVLKTGSRLKNGEYSIIRVLGQGGFGITYEAEQTGLSRKVAVKEFFMKEICNRDDATSQVSVPSTGSRELVDKFRRKFVREAKMIAALDNEHIVKVHDVFEENGTAYYVMEYLDGGSLNGRMRDNGAMPEAEALGYVRQIADALQYLHSQNILHFDVKPSNVLMGRNGRAKLIDFGISKHYDESGHQTSSTPVGISKGFAPLEQYRQGSDVSSFTPATDIYALGATLYALLAGENPPEASVVNEDGIPIIDGVTPTVMQAIESAMQPRRKDRPQSVGEFLSLLEGGSKDDGGADRAGHDAFVKDDSEDTVINGGGNAGGGGSVPPGPKPEPRKSWAKYSIIGGSVVLLLLGVFFLLFRGQKTVPALSPQITSATSVPTTGTNNGHEWVDLGLSVKWATCNVGATKPEDYGNYYAWGETRPKSDYSCTTLKYCNDDSGDSFSKYNQNKGGTVDNRIRLEMSDDTARSNWGGSWRMPTKSEFDELINKCSWSWTAMNGVNGYKVASKSNGNSIFLPAAGCRYDADLLNASAFGYYWSASLTEKDSDRAWVLYFCSDDRSTDNFSRQCGFAVRPVCP